VVTLNGKISLVTGAGRGIGREIALSLAKNGSDVVLTDVADSIFEVAKQIEALNVKALPLKCDVSDYTQVSAVEKKVSETFGKLDILVNNAGIYPYKAFPEMSVEDWNKVLHINLDGTFNVTRNFIPQMIKQHYGKIVNIASVAGSFVGFSNLVHYSASKAGIMGFTKSLALEVAQHGINVNAIAPGVIDVGGAAANPEAYAPILKTIPSGRLGLPLDIANLVVFLASEQASYITGQCIICDGGYTLP
jgi:3-oxoacyl-[acyl-carrier protein] reductase